MRRKSRGFSVVELIVVIGIIGLLAAMLFPAISAARARAASLQCQANLRQMGVAAHLHANAHRGYFPIAGLHWDLDLEPPGADAFQDSSVRRYTYYKEDGIDRPVPFTVALAVSMGVPVRLDSRETLAEDMQTEAVRKYFRCPSQAVQEPGISQSIGRWRAPDEWSSYLYSGAVTGSGKRNTDQIWSKVSKVRRPSTVLLAMDGKRRYPEGTELNWLGIPPTREFNGNRSTLADYRTASLDPAYDYLGREALDYLRHNWRANVLFVDGHVESVVLSEEGCRAVGLCKGIYE